MSTCANIKTNERNKLFYYKTKFIHIYIYIHTFTQVHFRCMKKGYATKVVICKTTGKCSHFLTNVHKHFGDEETNTDSEVVDRFKVG